MNKKVIILIVIALIIIVGGVLYFSRQEPQQTSESAPQQAAQKTEEQEVRELVIQFGDKMKMVSLLAPKDSLIKAIEENYGPYISPELLTGWREHPEWAPGRLTSSPWPNRINVLLVEHGDDGSYEVQGKIMEMTSVEVTSGGEIDSGQFVALKIRKQNDKWVITGFTKAVPQ